jgi:GNAT superfamily N-acetyltransferase
MRNMEPVVSPLTETYLKEADRICRLSFGTFLGLPDPMSFFGDADYVFTRFRTNPSLSLGAYMDGEIVGSNFIAIWGSVGIFGPLTVRPDLWDKGIGKHLLDRTMQIFRQHNVKHIGFLTFANSAKHIHIYQKYDFWPRFLTPVMSKPIMPKNPFSKGEVTSNFFKYSSFDESSRSDIIKESISLTDSIYHGLNLESEVQSVFQQTLGETILIRDKDMNLCGLAVCHCGAGTEAGSNTCYVKFGATISNGQQSALDLLENLLNSCEHFAASQGLTKLAAGVNVGNLDSYRKMIAKGFRTEFQGVLMTKNNDPGYHREDKCVIDDWR